MFEEFLFTWQERLRKLEQPTAMSVKLQGEVDKYKVLFVIFVTEEQSYTQITQVTQDTNN